MVQKTCISFRRGSSPECVFHASATPDYRMEHYAFIPAVVESLLVEGDSTVAAHAADLYRPVGVHGSEFLPPTPKRTKPTQKCVACTANGRRQETRYYYGDCLDRPASCVVSCHKAYHT